MNTFGVSKIEVARSLSRISGASFQESYLDLNRQDRPSVIDSANNLDIFAFHDAAKDLDLSTSLTDICSELCLLTGQSVGNVLRALTSRHIELSEFF